MEGAVSRVHRLPMKLGPAVQRRKRKQPGGEGGGHMESPVNTKEYQVAINTFIQQQQQQQQQRQAPNACTSHRAQQRQQAAAPAASRLRSSSRLP
jgi:hypothetical protein